MANILGIPNPTSGSDNTKINQSTVVSPNNGQNPNQVDPTRVPQNQERNEQKNPGEGKGEGRGKIDFRSNFGAFFQKLHESKELSGTLGTELLRFTTGDAKGGAVAVELAQMMKMLKMDEPELLKFIQDQTSSGSRFSGALFNAMRELFMGANAQGANNEVLKTDMLQFLKVYSDFSSTEHIETNILRTLDKLTRAIPASYGNKLATMTGELAAKFQYESGGEAEGDSERGEAMKILTGKIIPFLGDYTKKSHDMGLSRTLISVLTYNVARYESGSEDQLVESFHKLNMHGAAHAKLGGLTDDALMKLIKNTAFMHGSEQNHFANHLIEASAEAMTGDSGSEIEEVFKEVVNTFLINESVYMPLNHMTIPLDWFGRFMFSQMWVDPDAEDSMQKSEPTEPISKVLIKMDIQDLGLFDLIIATQGENAELMINCPEEVVQHTKQVQKDLANILRENAFKVQDVHVGKLETPLSIATVFPKIYERENGVDVKV